MSKIRPTVLHSIKHQAIYSGGSQNSFSEVDIFKQSTEKVGSEWFCINQSLTAIQFRHTCDLARNDWCSLFVVSEKQMAVSHHVEVGIRVT